MCESDGVTDQLSETTRRAIDALLAAAEPLDRVRAIRALSAALDDEPALLASVRSALDGGTTWDEIADAASLGTAAAKWRWQGTDADIEERHAAGRKRAARPSSRPTDLPGMSVADAARSLGVSVQAVYLRVSRGQLRAETITLDDGRSYKRVFPDA
jgi:hypothetical protein